jgi:hypothetical protein
MDVSLEAVAADSDAPKKKKGKGKKTDNDQAPIAEFVEFLEKYETAKTAIVVETHCLENGTFVWRGDEPANYPACSLSEMGVSDFLSHPVANAHHRFYAIVSQRRSGSTCRMRPTALNTYTGA